MDSTEIIGANEKAAAGISGADAATQELAVPAYAMPAEESEKPVQSPEQRRANAAERRRRERAEIEQQTQNRVDRAYTEAFRGKTNPATGLGIESEADFHRFRMESQESSRRPATAGTERPADSAGAPGSMGTDEARYRNMSRSLALGKAVGEIGRLDNAIRSPEDLLNMPSAEKFHELVLKGYALKDAFTLANFDALCERKTGAARQSALNRIREKSHMIETAVKGGGGSEIPADTLALYKKLFPGKTYVDFQRHYAKHKEKG